MSKVFVNIAMTLDGYMAPEGMTMHQPEYKNWGAKWGALMAWLINQQAFREHLQLGPGGETGPVNDLVRSTMARIGAGNARAGRDRARPARGLGRCSVPVGQPRPVVRFGRRRVDALEIRTVLGAEGADGAADAAKHVHGISGYLG